MFCSARGLAAITQNARAAAANGTRYSISAASPLIGRLGPHNWPDGKAPHIHRTTGAAVLSAVRLQADLWNPAPTTDTAGAHPDADADDPDSWLAGIREEADGTDAPSTEGGHQLRPDPHDADPATLRQALHLHRSTVYRIALHALGASYGTHSLAPDLAAQLRIALAGFTATPPGGPRQRRQP